MNTDFNLKKYSWIGFQIGVFFLFLSAAYANYHFYVTNDYSPGGDGSRIYPYLKYIQKVPEVIPLWQAHKHHGYPLFADPENYIPLSLILNTESKYFNLQLNLVFFFLTSIFAFTCRSIARLLGMTEVAAIAVGIVTVLCIPAARVFMHGTLTSLIAYVLIYIAILLIMMAIGKGKPIYRYMLIVASILLSWSFVTIGYYFAISFYIPALILISCVFLKNNECLSVAIKKTSFILLLTSIMLFLFSMPLLLPIVDGIILSKTFATNTPTIKISNRDLFNYYLNLWPFLILGFIASKGLFRRYSLLLLIMAGINYILILFEILQFHIFFNLWTNIPIIKNIRWQHPFRELSSIAAAFLAGIFIDSCRNKPKSKNHWPHLFILFCFILVAYKQYVLNLPLFMIVITLIFAALLISRQNFNIAVSLCLLVMLIMGYNFKVSPFGNKLYTSENLQSFRKYNGPYQWRSSYGLDKFTPVYNPGSFSMVFLNEYRILLTLLYQQKITAQRPHWIVKMDGVNIEKQNKKIAQLLAIKQPKVKVKQYKPFRVYDNYKIVDETATLKLMQKNDFSPIDTIILHNPPGFSIDENIDLQYSAKLIGKTADTLTLKVKTNKNSILLIPEIYHRDWVASIDGREAPVFKAFASMRSVVMTPGEHKIVMRFIYKPFFWGCGIAACSLIIASFLLFFFQHKLSNYFFICDVNEPPGP